jgi:hypothetical protein
MAYPGDPRACPEWARCVITATGAIKRSRDSIVGLTAVCWLNGNNHDSSPHHVTEALGEQLRISRHDVKVIKHYPEQYLLFFSDRGAYDLVLDHSTVHCRGRAFNFEPWSETRYAMESKLKFRVRLRIESLPVHAWNEAVVAQVIGEQCAIHYVEEYSRRCDRTRTYDLWAWCADPSKVPKGVLLTIVDPDSEQSLTGNNRYEILHDPPADYKGAFDYELKLHVDVVEDLLFLHGGWRDAPPNRKARRKFLWSYGSRDSLGEKRDGQRNTNNRHGRDSRPRRDDHHRGTRRHRSSPGWSRASHCRGAIDDCYNTTRYRGGNYSHSSYRNRRLSPPHRWGHGGGRNERNQKMWVAKSKKKVSFASPLTQVLGESKKSFALCPQPLIHTTSCAVHDTIQCLRNFSSLMLL